MKNKFTLSSIMPKSGPFGLALAGLILAAAPSHAGPAEVLPPSSLPYGASYQEWAARWWQWSLGQSTDDLQYVGRSGICDSPGSQVMFLAGIYGFGVNVETRHISIPAETPLFLSILSFVADNTACPVSDFTSYTGAQLTAEAEDGWNSAASLTTCTVDNVSVAGLDDPTNSIYNVVSPPFSYTTAEHDNILVLVEGEPCIPGGLTIYPAVTDGVYLMLAPLSPGKHTIHFVGVAGPLDSPFVKIDLTYDIDVSIL